MRLKSKFLTGAGVVLAVSSLGIGTSFATTPDVNVTNHTLTCDTVTGTIKPTTGLTFNGTPGSITNGTVVKVALDGCTDNTDGTVVVSATKFTVSIPGGTWVAGNGTAGHGCDLDPAAGNTDNSTVPATPPGSGSHVCQAHWIAAEGGKADNAQHPTDINGAFGENNFSGLAGASTSGSDTVPLFVWKCAVPTTKAKCTDSVNNVAGKAETSISIPNTFGSTIADPFGVARGAFYVGKPLNGTNGIPANTLGVENVSGAFSGSDSGHTSTFEGQLQQSVTVLAREAGSKTGIKSLSFATGIINSA